MFVELSVPLDVDRESATFGPVRGAGGLQAMEEDAAYLASCSGVGDVLKIRQGPEISRRDGPLGVR